MNFALRCLVSTVLLVALASAQYVAVDITPPTFSGTLAATSGSVQGGAVFSPAIPAGHAFLYNGVTTRDVNPGTWFASQVLGAAGNEEVGYGLKIAAPDLSGAHALLWRGFSSKFISLHVAKWRFTLATCTNGVIQGGYGIPPKGSGKPLNNKHALLWSGTAASAIDINPVGFVESQIFGCGDAIQVGQVTLQTGGATHAALWSGSANSMVDLNPSGAITSLAVGAAGTEQVGSGVITTRHALLWHGSADNVIDLHPAGYALSALYGTNGTQQVGTATDNAAPPVKHAMVWSGTADSGLDLNQFLPRGFTDAEARGIDANGNIVGFAFDPATGNHMIEWIKVP